MSLSAGKVGIAPGTTTLTIGRGGSVTLVGHATQDPGVVVRNAYGRLMGAELGYFDAKPTDFDLSKIYGYTPVHRGWLVGKLSTSNLGGCCSGCAVGGACSGGLGEETATLEPALDPAQEKAIAQFVMNQLTLESKSLELKERRSRRFWGAVIGLASATTALVTVLAHVKSR